MKTINFHKTILIIVTIITLVANNVLINYLGEFPNIVSKIINSSGNIGGVIIASLLFYLVVKTNYSFYLLSTFVAIGFVCYEFLQIVIPWQTFDILDIIGSIVGLILACLLHLIYRTSTKN